MWQLRAWTMVSLVVTVTVAHAHDSDTVAAVVHDSESTSEVATLLRQKRQVSDRCYTVAAIQPTDPTCKAIGWKCARESHNGYGTPRMSAEAGGSCGVLFHYEVVPNHIEHRTAVAIGHPLTAEQHSALCAVDSGTNGRGSGYGRCMRISALDSQAHDLANAYERDAHAAHLSPMYMGTKLPNGTHWHTSVGLEEGQSYITDDVRRQMYFIPYNTQESATLLCCCVGNCYHELHWFNNDRRLPTHIDVVNDHDHCDYSAYDAWLMQTDNGAIRQMLNNPCTAPVGSPKTPLAPQQKGLKWWHWLLLIFLFLIIAAVIAVIIWCCCCKDDDELNRSPNNRYATSARTTNGAGEYAGVSTNETVTMSADGKRHHHIHREVHHC